MKITYELPDSIEIVDAHTHIGSCQVFGGDTDEQTLIDSRATWNIKKSIVLPSPGTPDAVAVHNRIAALAKRYPGQYHGLVSMNPQLGMVAFEQEARRCIEELGFVGIKLHPYGHGVPSWSPLAFKVFEVANKLNVPMVIHTGIGAPGALPAMVIPAARAFPDTTIVLYHSGAYVYSLEAIIAAQHYPNIMLETSWCAVIHLKRFVNEVGLDRVMFGADIVENVDTEVIKYITSGLSHEELAACFGNNARKIFNLT